MSRATVEPTPVGCRYCDFASGFRGGDSCSKCEAYEIARATERGPTVAHGHAVEAGSRGAVI